MTDAQQKLITLTNSVSTNAFFNVPVSAGSLKSYLDSGWLVLWMNIDGDMKSATVLLQKGTINQSTTTSNPSRMDIAARVLPAIIRDPSSQYGDSDGRVAAAYTFADKLVKAGS